VAARDVVVGVGVFSSQLRALPPSEAAIRAATATTSALAL